MPIKPITEDDDFMTLAEVATVYRVSVATVRSWRLKGVEGTPGYGPVGVTVGRRVLYRRNDVYACVPQQRSAA